MPITINGSGTVTGISVGGLPDGIVDTDMIADSAVTGPKHAAGSVIQTTSSGNIITDFSSTSDSYVTTNVTHSITPSATSSKILVLVAMDFGYTATANVQAYPRLALYRDSTEITAIEYALRLDSSSSGCQYHGGAPFIYLDSPNTTSAVAYTVYAKSHSSHGSTNRASWNEDSNVTLLEIKG